jgi:hypothetical protein
MVKGYWVLLAAILVTGVPTACKRGIDNQEAVRQGVINYLSQRSNLNVSAMNVNVTTVSFRQNEADAVVAFTAKGAAPGQPMSFRYTLERQGDHWVVKGGADAGGSAHGAAGENPHSAANPNPHGAADPLATGELPPGHPPVDSTEPKQ